MRRDDEPGDDERQPVEVERDVDRATVEDPHQPGSDPVDDGEQGEEERPPAPPSRTSSRG